MQGFATKGLIVCPKVETYESRNLQYQLQLLDSIRNIIKYMKSVGVEPYCISTDELSHTLDIDVKWVSPVMPGDLFFIRNNVRGFQDMQEPVSVGLEQELSDIANKFKFERGASAEVRFNTLLKREVRGVKAIMDDFKIIVSFQHPGNPVYKLPTPTEGDGKIIMTVNHVSFLAETFIGGTQIPTNQLLQISTALLPVNKWEV